MRLIDADAFRKELDNHWPFTKDEQCKHGFADMAKSAVLFVLNKMPTIEPEPSDVARDIATIIENEKDMRVIGERKRGKWIDGKVKHIENGELRNVRECSECGSSYFVYDYYNSVDEIPKFCPSCGADMRGGETNE